MMKSDKKDPSVMLISNGTAVKYHKDTGRELNVMRGDQYVSVRKLWSDEFESKIRAGAIANHIISEYREGKRIGPTTQDLILRLMIWLVTTPSKPIAMSNRATKTSYKTTKGVIDWLEVKGYIQVYQGFPTKSRVSRPMVIAGTNKLLNLNVVL
jgi:hypothetical protein